jgi:hypothetical protein
VHRIVAQGSKKDVDGKRCRLTLVSVLPRLHIRERNIEIIRILSRYTVTMARESTL